MLHGEFESMKAMHALSPDFIPKPIAWGTYETIPDTHFFLCQYRHMTDAMPDPYNFSDRLAALHKNSESPNGKFGFHITTYSGNLPQMNEWEESWELYFAKNMKLALDLEIEANGSDPEFDVLIPNLFDRIIPRLLRPLESEGRSVKPSLVHGDLWYANSGVDVVTGESLVFDACCFYAHNECEIYNPPGLRNQKKLTRHRSIQMNLASGGQSATDSGTSTYLRTTHTSRSLLLKTIMTGALTCTNCDMLCSSRK